MYVLCACSVYLVCGGGGGASFVSCIHFRILCFLFYLAGFCCAIVAFPRWFQSFPFIRQPAHSWLFIRSLSNCIPSRRKQSRKLLLYSHLWHIIDSSKCAVKTLLIRGKNEVSCRVCRVVADITWLCANENKTISAQNWLYHGKKWFKRPKTMRPHHKISSAKSNFMK